MLIKAKLIKRHTESGQIDDAIPLGTIYEYDTSVKPQIIAGLKCGWFNSLWDHAEGFIPLELFEFDEGAIN